MRSYLRTIDRLRNLYSSGRFDQFDYARFAVYFSGTQLQAKHTAAKEL